MQNGTYAIYLRKSREDIESEKYGEGETLARHEKILTTLASTRNLTIGKIYREVVSGETISERKEMQKLLKDVENEKWSGVLVVEVERLARGDTADQGRVSKAFKYSHTKIITPVKTYDPDNEFDEEYFEFGLFMSRREYKTINRRLQRGREVSVSEGKFVGNIAPFGYNRVKLQDSKGYTLSINQDEAPIVKEIFRLYTFESNTINSVAKQLNNMNLKPRISDEWTISSVKAVGRLYSGTFRGDHFPGRHPRRGYFPRIIRSYGLYRPWQYPVPYFKCDAAQELPDPHYCCAAGAVLRVRFELHDASRRRVGQSRVRRQLLPDGEVRGKVAAQGQRKVRPELHEHYVLPEISRTVPCNDSRSVRSVY